MATPGPDHKMVKQWTRLPKKSKIKCCICEKRKATLYREFIAGKITLHHCDKCHELHVPKRRY